MTTWTRVSIRVAVPHHICPIFPMAAYASVVDVSRAPGGTHAAVVGDVIAADGQWGVVLVLVRGGLDDL